MRDMGDASADVWDAELRRTGRVVFPLRRRVTLVTYPLLVLVLALQPLYLLLDGVQPDLVGNLIWAALFAGFIGTGLYRFIAQRPVVVVDQEGVRYGRRKYLPWGAVRGIGIVSGLPGGRSLLVHPWDMSAKSLRLFQQNVRDMPAFRHWLETVLAEHWAGSGQA
ncbi:hypothetical protein ACFV9C_14565 [Kribbella sp. NPDC059898]|uniref:hypothetical protein n=1 Tax=Kribbella sp. NPDC059898 TaxID=3346995 RepID=UPI0036645120